ncbi:hypothetical protein BB934_26360 [Microvirga ossetica]|uniref:DUF3893 domain-containing protein n=1 Tax=Microvirga ossetica TaxID=1882682 RepID=A0A1B2EMV5_9HYPH|nr:RNaseH domain-containing protein [Microvirga ossetica]ANY81308.1 hypothetical protein BB934_26360 [Microvirga ossetica]
MTDGPSYLLPLSGKAQPKTANVAMALRPIPGASEEVHGIRMGWSGQAEDLFRAIASSAKASRKPEAGALPYAALRAAIAAAVTDAVLVSSDLGRIGRNRDAEGPAYFLDVIDDGTDKAVKAATRATKLWVDNVLAPWSENVGVSEALLDDIRDLANDGGLLVQEKRAIDIAASIGSDAGAFVRAHDAIHALLARRLTGIELFEGLGPVKRIVRSATRSNEISFETWPHAMGEDQWSMVATFAVETVPGSDNPIVRVEATRRRWCRRVPDASDLRRQTRLGGIIMAKDRDVSVRFDCGLRKGEIVEPVDPAFVMQAFGARLDLSSGFAELVEKGAQKTAFVGIPYHNGYSLETSVGSGVTERDLLDLFDAVSERVSDVFQPVPVTQNDTTIKRIEDQHVALKLQSVLGWVAASHGLNELDDKSLAEAWALLVDGEPPANLDATGVNKALTTLQELQATNRDRIRRTFGNDKPTVVVIAPSQSERTVLERIIGALFGKSVDVISHRLPNVHGAQKRLPAGDGSNAERYAARIEAWKPLADVLSEKDGCHVLVQATDWYTVPATEGDPGGKRPDDRVNKPAGRIALARGANANVQYLRPPEPSAKRFQDYLFRVQAALLDLLFGHAGLVSEIQTPVASAFPKADTRPKSIIGISVISKSRSRAGTKSSQLLMATSVDVATGRTTAILGRRLNGVAQWTEERPLFESLREAAAWVTPNLGDNEDARRDTYQRFVNHVIGGACERGQRPLVLFDATSASGLWPALRDKDIGRSFDLLGRSLDPASDWMGARLVRIRTDVAPRVIVRKVRKLARLDADSGRTLEEVVRYAPTTIVSTFRMGGVPHPFYLSMGTNDGKQKIAKGLSVYRDLAYPYKLPAKAEMPAALKGKEGLHIEQVRSLKEEFYKIAGPIDIAVMHCHGTDDPDAIASLVTKLRSGYGHTASSTSLPAPLFFETKLRDYVPSFVLDEDDPEPDDAESVPSLSDQSEGEAEKALPAPSTEDGSAVLPPVIFQHANRAMTASIVLPPTPPTSINTKGLSNRAEGPLSDRLQRFVERYPEREEMVRRFYVDVVPDFVTPEWVKQHVTVSPAFLRKLDPLWREVIITAPFYLWPKDRPPTEEEFYEVVSDLFRIVPGIGALYGKSRKAKPKLGVRGIFHRWYDAVHAMIRQKKGPYRTMQAPVGPLETIKALAKMEKWDELRSFILIESIHGGHANREFIEAVVKIGQPVADLLPYILRLIAFEQDTGAAEYSGQFTRVGPDGEVLEGEPSSGELSAEKGNLERGEPANWFEGIDDESLEGDAAPTIVIPAFLDRIWLKDKISLSGAVKSQLHLGRETLRKHARNAKFWPQARPEGDAIIDLLLKGFEYPFLHTAVASIVVSKDGTSPRDRSIFRPFYRKVDGVLRGMLDTVKERTGTDDVGTLTDLHVLECLLIDKQTDLARDFCVLRGSELLDENLLPAIADEPGFGDVADFLRSRRAQKAWLTQQDDPLIKELAEAASEELAQTARRDSIRTTDADGDAGFPEVSDLSEGIPSTETHSTDEVLSMETEDRSSTSNGKLDEGRQGVVSISGGMEEARASFRKAFGDLDALVRQHGNDDPSPDIVDRLRHILTVVSASVVAYEAARPRRVDAEPYRERAIEARRSLVGLVEYIGLERTLPDVPSPTDLSMESADQIEVSLGRTESALCDTDADRERVNGIQEKLASAKLLQRAQLNQEMERESEMLLGHFETAYEGFDEVTTLLAAEVLPVPEETPKVAHNETSDVAEEVEEDREEAFWAARNNTEVSPQVELPSVGEAEKSDIEGEANPVAEEVTVPPRQEPVTEAEVPVAATFEAEAAEAPAVLVTDEDEITIDEDDLRVLSDASDGGEPEAEVEPEIVEEDPEVARVNEKIWEFVASHELGLAYHLVEAAGSLHAGSSLDMTPEELRFAAMAGNVNHASLHATPMVVQDAVVKALASIEEMPPSDEIAGSIRRMLMYPSALELTLFHSDAGAGEVLRSLNGLVEPVREETRALSESVQRFARSRLPFSPAVLHHISNTMEAESDAETCRKEIISRVDLLSRTQFSYQLGAKIRTALLQPGKEVGDLRDAMKADDAAALAAARRYVNECSTRSQILDMLYRAELAVNSKYKGLDGAARDKLVGSLLDLGARCAEYIDRRNAVTLVSASEQPKLKEAVADLRRHLAAACEAFDRLAEDEAYTSVARYVVDRYRRLDKVLAGDAATPPAYGHMLELHGSLPLLPDFHFGRSWYPAPYDAGEVCLILQQVRVPLLPEKGEARDRAYEGLFRQRIDETSFVGARLLVELAEHHGISEAMRDNLSDSLSADLDAARVELAQEIDRARSLVERVIRYGSILKPDEALSALSKIDRIGSAEVPVVASLEERDEAIDGERIDDIRLASILLAETEDEVRALMDEPRNRLLARVDALEGRISSHNAQRLRTLCAGDDLLTAEEFVVLAEKTGEIPTPPSRLRRFEEFSTTVLPAMTKLGKAYYDRASSAINDGIEFCGLRFDELSPARRDEAAVIFGRWWDTVRRIETVKTDQGYAAKVTDFLEGLGIRANLRDPSNLTNAQQKRFVGDFDFSLLRDTESLLLPDFGSLTDQYWRVAIMATMPGDAQLTEICHTGQKGVIVFVGDVVSKERRQQFMLQNLQARRRVILVDSASILYALGEPEMRPLTLLELGQPFSYAEPYRDWGRESVPVEMFRGRSKELATLFDTHGSCIVYGGRRLGKTALLKHLQATKHDPKGEILVAFVDAQSLTQGPEQHLTRRIWEEIARNLPTIFTKQGVTEPARVIETIQRWLEVAPRRRVILLIDEADDFVTADAAQGYTEFFALQKLMTDTGRRFKFILSGLHNVTRFVQTGNDPLKQISSDPQRIGPLMGDEMGDAEDLVVRPFAALGMEFERREDIWRILSHSNYYPVLVQTYAKHLLEIVNEEIKRTNHQVRTISRSLVSEVLERRQASDEVREKFRMTLRIDQRYELLAYVVAHLVLGNEAEGKIDEGVTVREIRDAAVAFWPRGFVDPNRFSLFEDLVDEMEGLGILRRTPTNRWTLRSTAVTRLLGNRDEIDDKLLEFGDRKPLDEFDPKSARRPLEPTIGYNIEHRQSSPLTLGQERDILTDLTPVKLVFGTNVADIDLVSLSLRNAANSFSEADKCEVSAQTFPGKQDLSERLTRIRGTSAQRQNPVVVVVDSRSDWGPDWVAETMRARAVIDSLAKVVFVGRPKHLERFVNDPRFTRPTGIKVIPLEPWSAAFLESEIVQNHPTLDQTARERMIEACGGWNAPMSWLFHADRGDKHQGRSDKGSARGNKLQGRIDRLVVDVMGAQDILARLGLDGSFGDICRSIASYTGSSFTLKDVADTLTFSEIRSGAGGWASAEAIVNYGINIGAFQPVAGHQPDDESKASYTLAPLARRLLEVEIQEAA